jgi:CMP-N,N'-diacetyllegionaminic acid synthase
MRVLGLIPARGGSKGVPRKNVALLGNRPLLAYTTAVAAESRRLTRVILSTDDEEIASVGRQWGVDVPFMRPSALAQDDTPMLPVVQHALRTLEEAGEHYDAVCLLQPTSPLRQASDIDGCVELLETTGSDAVVTVLPVPSEYNPHWTFMRDSSGYLRISTGEATPITRRQELPPAFHREGSVYVTRRDVVMVQNSLYGNRLAGYVVDGSHSVNIDEPADFAHAQALIAAAQ